MAYWNKVNNLAKQQDGSLSRYDTVYHIRINSWKNWAKYDAYLCQNNLITMCKIYSKNAPTISIDNFSKTKETVMQIKKVVGKTLEDLANAVLPEDAGTELKRDWQKISGWLKTIKF